jgi:uncharacterized membrane protein HdeD (DUF308 family)
MTALALLYVIAVWAGLTGIAELSAAVRTRREIRGEWLLAMSGLLSLGTRATTRTHFGGDEGTLTPGK